MVRLVCTATALLFTLCCTLGQVDTSDLTFGQVYGTAGFLSLQPSGTVTEAPNVVLAFTAADGHRNLVLTQQMGDYIALLEQGRYCIRAYTRAGKALQLAQNQLKCVDVVIGKDVRLDIMLIRDAK
ncbi:MAG: hypothetical protein AB1898_32935 [Acidobacteriota bacterium]